MESRLALVACAMALELVGTPIAVAAPPGDGTTDSDAGQATEDSKPAAPSPTVDAPDSTPSPRPIGPDGHVGVLSDAGSDRGELELGLGSVTLALGLGLVAVGAVELHRGLDRRARCAASFSQSCIIDAPPLIFAASGLSFAFSVPALVGGALLLRKGVSINRDYRAVHARSRARVSASPTWSGRRGVGVNVRVRF